MIVLFLIIPMCIGFFISLLAYLPPLNSIGRISATLRLLLVFSLGLATFIIFYGTITYIAAQYTYHMGTWQYECQYCDQIRQIYVPLEYTQEEMEHEKAIIIEYWAREILPPVFLSSCNTKHPTVCRLADDIRSRKLKRYISPVNAEQIKRNDFLLNFRSSFFGSISTVFFVHLFTRRKDVHSRIPLF
jgi:hypothetical protein